MICSVCDHANKDDARFCEQFVQSLGIVCPAAALRPEPVRAFAACAARICLPYLNLLPRRLYPLPHLGHSPL